LNIDRLNPTIPLKDFNIQNSAEKIEEQGFEAKLKKAMDEKDEESLKKVCNDFESIFMGIIYKQMKSTVMKSDLMPQSNAQNIFESMLDDELTKESAKAGGIGLGDMLFNQFKKDMENKYSID
jgi:peptidoglycan hydrolase FlgJ